MEDSRASDTTRSSSFVEIFSRLSTQGNEQRASFNYARESLAKIEEEQESESVRPFSPSRNSNEVLNNQEKPLFSEERFSLKFDKVEEEVSELQKLIL